MIIRMEIDQTIKSQIVRHYVQTVMQLKHMEKVVTN
jgi:hypothetical protein